MMGWTLSICDPNLYHMKLYYLVYLSISLIVKDSFCAHPELCDEYFFNIKIFFFIPLINNIKEKKFLWSKYQSKRKHHFVLALYFVKYLISHYLVMKCIRIRVYKVHLMLKLLKDTYRACDWKTRSFAIIVFIQPLEIYLFGQWWMRK